MITLPTASAKKPLAAAKEGEKKKRDKYERFKAQCARENPDDPRLSRGVTPIVFETYGAAGPTALEHMSLIRHQYLPKMTRAVSLNATYERSEDEQVQLM